MYHMSASDKKKLRKEQEAAILSEKQRKQQAETKKLAIYTTCFVVAMVLVAGVFLGVLGVNFFKSGGFIEKNTIAATIGDRKLNSVEFNYYYTDTINEFYNDWYNQSSEDPDAYLYSVMGLDTSLPLNEQIQDEETGKTWADYFVDAAIDQAKSDYAMYDLAATDDTFALPEEDQQTLENVMNNLSTYAKMYGMSVNKYLAAMYGPGASKKSYEAYYERSLIATAYTNAHKDSITYDDAAIRQYESDKLDNFTSYTYYNVYMSYSAFLQGGTEDEDGATTYSDEEKNAARAALKAAAEKLATAKSLDELKALTETIEVVDGYSVTVNESYRVLHTSLNATLSDWLCNDARQEGDIEAIPNYVKDEDGNETDQANGYYVVLFGGKTDNTEPMGNVRHLLVQFEGGQENEETGETVYSDEEKAAAKEEADGYLKTWQEGDANEASFIELVKAHSDDTSAEDGGLFEDINPASSYVDNFLNWSIDPVREAGDAEVIETEYGYHVMYYVGDSELNYRDYMITNEMRAADQEAWYNSIVEPITTSVGNTSKIKLDLVMSPA